MAIAALTHAGRGFAAWLRQAAMTLVDATAAIVLLSLLLEAVAVPLLKPDGTPTDHRNIGVVALCALAALYEAHMLRCGGRAWQSWLVRRGGSRGGEEE